MLPAAVPVQLRRAFKLDTAQWRATVVSLGSLLVNALHPNLADPDYEPSDDELAGLTKRAFAGVKEAERLRLEKLRGDIARAREEALARLGDQGSNR